MPIIFVSRRALQAIKEEIRRDILADQELIKQSIQQFTRDVVECLSNNFDGFSMRLENKPCKAHSKSLDELKEKYLDHEKRILNLEKKVKALENEDQ